MAEQSLFEVRWSAEILNETRRALVTKLGIDPARADRRIQAMRSAFPEAEVAGYEGLQDGLECDPKDWHVLAAAITAGAQSLVTLNLKDFPPEACEPHGVATRDPDFFLLDLYLDDDEACERAVDREAGRMLHPPLTRTDVLAGVAPIAPSFANVVHNHWGERGSDIPAYEAIPATANPLLKAFEAPDLTDPAHVAIIWWSLLQGDEPDAVDILHVLTWSPTAFGNYNWARDMLDGLTLASKVYYAVDDSSGDVAYMRFVPDVAQSARVFAPFHGSRSAYVTLRRNDTGHWTVWGLGRIAPVSDVLQR